MEDQTAIEGVPASRLSDDLLRELASVHRTRHDTLRHGCSRPHTTTSAELSDGVLRRFPNGGARSATVGARARPACPVPQSLRHRGIRSGAEQPWDPEDLAIAQGRDPTAENLERARRELERYGPAAIERTVPG